MSIVTRAAICGLGIVLPGVLSAATLTATFAEDFVSFGWDGASAGSTAFVIEFDDTLGTSTGVLEGSEFLSFSWITNPFMGGGNSFRELLANAPSVSGIVESFRTSVHTGTPNESIWVFQQAAGSFTASSIGADVFSYSITGLVPPTDPGPDPEPSPVPLPAGLPLLGAGLTGLLALRRKRRGAA